MEFRRETRGLRNNNPGNIKHGNAWRGEIVGKDETFESFAFVEHGIRALYVTLNTYRLKHGLKTVKEIIARWAPPFENHTKNYVMGVLAYMSKASLAGKAATTEHGENLDVYKLDLYDELVAAIIFYESGFNPFSLEYIRSCKNS